MCNSLEILCEHIEYPPKYEVLRELPPGAAAEREKVTKGRGKGTNIIEK